MRMPMAIQQAVNAILRRSVEFSISVWVLKETRCIAMENLIVACGIQMIAQQTQIAQSLVYRETPQSNQKCSGNALETLCVSHGNLACSHLVTAVEVGNIVKCFHWKHKVSYTFPNRIPPKDVSMQTKAQSIPLPVRSTQMVTA